MGTAAAKKLVLVLMKVMISGALLAYVLRKAGMGNVASHLREMDTRFFLIAVLIYLLLSLLTAIRWRLLLGGGIGIGRIFSLSLIGSFFNMFLPGAVGGDAVKIYYLYRETKQGGRALASVFMDRYIGYAGLLSLGLVASLSAFRRLTEIGIQWVVPAIFGAFLIGSVAVFGIRIGRRFSSVANFYDFFHTTLQDRPVVAKAYLISLVVQSLNILSVYAIARGMGQRPPIAELFVFVPIIVSVMMVPISISGLGLREGAFVVLFGLIAIPPEAATSISFLWFLSMVTGSLVGLVEYFRFKKLR